MTTNFGPKSLDISMASGRDTVACRRVALSYVTSPVYVSTFVRQLG